MDNATFQLLAGGLVIAWLLGPLIVIHYRMAIVPRRYEEIRDRFLSNPAPDTMVPTSERSKSGAWHYARLLDPDADPADPEAVLKAQFWHFHGWNRYAIPLVLVVILSGLMLAFSGLWVAELLGTTKGGTDKATPPQTNAPAPSKVAATNNSGNTDGSAKDSGANSRASEPTASLLGRVKAPFVMAIWGAFVWSLYEMQSRRKSGDLTPVELYDVALRFVVAIPIGYAFSLLVFDTVPALAAFAASAFPLRDIQQLIRKQSLQRLSDSPQASSSSVFKGNIGEVLSGIGNDTIVRLQELNIETYLDLAYTDPIRLMIKTGVPIQLVLSWIDQALLAVYAAPHKSAFDLLGMPCALDICEFYTTHCFDLATGQYQNNWRNDQAVKDLAAKLEISIDILVPQLLKSVFQDPHTQFLIRVWYGPAKSESSL